MPGVDTPIGMDAGVSVFTLIGEDTITLITDMATLTILTTTLIIATTITPIIHIDIGGRRSSVSTSGITLTGKRERLVMAGNLRVPAIALCGIQASSFQFSS